MSLLLTDDTTVCDPLQLLGEGGHRADGVSFGEDWENNTTTVLELYTSNTRDSTHRCNDLCV